MSKKTIFWLIVFAILLWWLLWRNQVQGSGEFAYVGFDADGRPYPLVKPAEPVTMEIPRTWLMWFPS